MKNGHPRTERSNAVSAAAMALGALVFAAAAAVPAQEAAPATPTPATPTPVPPVQQVRIEVRVLEWQLQNTTDYDFAILWAGNSPGGIVDTVDLTLPSNDPLSSAARMFLTGMDTGSGSIDAVVETLERIGTVETLVNTSVIVTVGGGNDVPDAAKRIPGGKVTSGEQIPYESVKSFGVRLGSTTEYRDTGIVLECWASAIRYDEFIQLHLISSVTDLSGFINIGVNNENDPLRVPVLERRAINNQIVVRDRSIFIAGLLKATREIERRQGIPWISELPILRWFLSNLARDTKTTELVFLVRPEILKPVKID